MCYLGEAREGDVLHIFWELTEKGLLRMDIQRREEDRVQFAAQREQKQTWLEDFYSRSALRNLMFCKPKKLPSFV